MPPRPKPVILVIADGWGVGPIWGGNAMSLANLPFFRKACQIYPNTVIQAAGEAVGLPAGERGNSEVGHLTMGSGHVALESYPSISKAITEGTFFSNPALARAFDLAKANNKAVHLMGLVSPGGIHSHLTHLYALLDMAKQRGVSQVYIHAFTDGRDAPPFSSQSFLSQVDTKCREIGLGQIVTISGRYYAMDRDMHWERIEKVYKAMTECVGRVAHSPAAAVAAAYRDGFSDEFIPPTVVQGEGYQPKPLQDGDSVIFFNFRGDRAREITRAIVEPNFDGFARKITLKNLYFAGFTFYQEGLPIQCAFRPGNIFKPLAFVLAQNNLKQLHLAESEKYAHVTYFFNGGIEKPFPGEERIIIPSPRVPSYDQMPAMSSVQVGDTVLKNFGSFDFIVVNFANPDMVGHSGNLKATIQACEAVDIQIKRIADEVTIKGGVMFFTGDHGNAEQKVNPMTGEPDTEHTANPVPLLLVSENPALYKLRPGGGLSDVAPTILDIMGLQISDEMTGHSLLTRVPVAIPAKPQA